MTLHRIWLNELKRYSAVRKHVEKLYRPISWSVYKTQYSYFTTGCNDKSLENQLQAMMRFSGPMTIHDFMREVLTNPVSGYYMKNDVFGTKGDYITSPEVSQIFGELIGVWIFNEWTKMGSPRPFQLAEFGPGRGTLMHDAFRAFGKLCESLDAIEIHFIERSPLMSDLQEEKFCGKRTSSDNSAIKTNEIMYKSSTTSNGTPIFWHTHLDGVPQQFTFFIAHEFFDALPIHKFRKTENGWREILIDIQNDDSSLKAPFRYVLSREETPTSKIFIRKDESRSEVEVCPEATTISKNIASHIEKCGGASLIIDYGHNGSGTDTFRAFHDHKQVNPLENVGHCDITADVDFSSIRRNVEEMVLCHGIVEQRFFLRNMGIEMRLKQLLKNASLERTKGIISGYQMLVEPNQMGSCFKLFSMFPKVMEEIHKEDPPAGFAEAFPEKIDGSV